MNGLFIQITGTRNHIFALTANGTVYRYVDSQWDSRVQGFAAVPGHWVSLSDERED